MSPRRMAPLGCLAAGAILAAGCGDSTPASREPQPRVRLVVTTPVDTAVVDAGSLSVSGRVSPASARVVVAGRRAEAVSGRFHVDVPLDVGANVIDLAATAQGARPALRAIRVTREDKVTVPEVAGTRVDEAQQALVDAGLDVAIEDVDTVFDRLIPGVHMACEVIPAAGERVPRGSRVRLLAGKSC